MTFFDRIRTLFLLDRDTLEIDTKYAMTERECRDALSAFMQTYPEVQAFAEGRLREFGVTNVTMPMLCNLGRPSGTVTGRMRAGHPSLDNMPRYGWSPVEEIARLGWWKRFRKIEAGYTNPGHVEPLNEDMNRILWKDDRGYSKEPMGLTKLISDETYANHVIVDGKMIMLTPKQAGWLNQGKLVINRAEDGAWTFTEAERGDSIVEGIKDALALELHTWFTHHHSPSHFDIATQLSAEYLIEQATFDSTVPVSVLTAWLVEHGRHAEKLTKAFRFTKRGV